MSRRAGKALSVPGCKIVGIDESEVPAADVTTMRLASRLAWDRARGFTVVARIPKIGDALSVLPAVLTWPVWLGTVGSEARGLRWIPGASLALFDGRPRRRWGPSLLAVALLVLELVVGFVVVLEVVLADASLAVLQAGDRAARATVFVLFVVLIVLLVRWLVRDRPVKRRREEFAADGPAYLLTSLVRSRTVAGGVGKDLLRRLKREWVAERAVVVGYAANASLARYYWDLGARFDGKSRRRMLFDCRDGDPEQLPPSGARG